MRKILIIDDNPTNNEYFITPLRNSYYVDVAMNVLAAERKLTKNEYDMIIIDVMMPTLHLETNNEMTTGYEFYRQVVSKHCAHSEITFWTRQTEESFNKFQKTQNKTLYFIQKKESDKDHLLKHVNKILKNSKE